MQDHISWVAGFGTLASTLGVSLAIFLLGIKRYKKQGPIGSPFTKVVQVFVAAAHKWRVNDTHDVLGVCFGEKLNDVQVEAQLDMTKRVRIFRPDPKNTQPEPDFFDPKQKRVDP